MGIANDGDKHVPAPERDQVLAGVRDELARWGIDRFSTLALADRHGWDPAAVTAAWPDADQLILEALTTRPGDHPEAPDTGSLVGDLHALATSMAALLSGSDGRKLHGAHLIADPGMCNIDIRRAAWRARADRMRVIFERAQRRGELRDDIDHEAALQLVFAPINMRILYTGDPVDDDYCLTLAAMVFRAISVE